MRTRVFCLAMLAPLLGACESSMRLPPMTGPFGNSERVSPSPTPAAPPRIEAAPSPRVESAPLPPPVEQSSLPPPSGAAGMPQNQGIGTTPGSASGAATPESLPKTANPEPPRVASAEVSDTAAPTRSSVTGNWQAREASGGACRVTLSSAPKLDLYGASTSGCQSKDLQRVTAWELRGEDVYLYEPGGTVAARLKARGGRMDGALAKSGAPVTLSK